MNSAEPSTLADRLMRTFWRQPADTVGERARRRISVYLIPYLFFLYILAYLDRVNVSVAALGMEKSPEEGGLGFTTSMVGFGAGIFFWGYWILEIPSTITVVKWGARYVFIRILVLWGLSCTLIGAIGTPFANRLFAWLPTLPEGLGFVAEFVNGLPTSAEHQFYFFRFMLGFFEGGFFPSVIVYLSLWFRAADRAKAIACFMAAIPLSNVLGQPLSGLLLRLDWFDLPGWRWIFILQGVVPVVAGVTTLFFLPNRPADAAWLPADEKEWIRGELEREHAAKHGHTLWMQHLGIVLLLTLAYFCLNVTLYGLQMFMPAIIKSQIQSDWEYADQLASGLAALPYLMALIGMLVNGWSSDRRRERVWHVAVPSIVMSAGIALAALCDGLPVLPVLAMVLMAGFCLYAWLPAYWPIPTIFLGALAAASAVGFINMIGNLGGFVGPVLVGQSAQEHSSFAEALFILAPLPLVAAGIVLGIGYLHRDRLANEKDQTPPQT